MLEGVLYEVVSREEGSAVVRLLPDSPVYAAHFPGYPITPGIFIQIILNLIKNGIRPLVIDVSARCDRKRSQKKFHLNIILCQIRYESFKISAFFVSDLRHLIDIAVCDRANPVEHLLVSRIIRLLAPSFVSDGSVGHIREFRGVRADMSVLSVKGRNSFHAHHVNIILEIRPGYKRIFNFHRIGDLKCLPGDNTVEFFSRRAVLIVFRPAIFLAVIIEHPG